MNILILSHRFYPDVGGIETLTDILASHFTANGNKVHVLTWSAEANSKEFPFVGIRNPSLLVLRQEHLWAYVIIENNICLRLSWPNLFIRRPIITGLQTWIAPSPGVDNVTTRLKFWWLNRVNAVVSCSEVVRNVCYKSSIVIANPYNDDQFRQIPNVERTKDFVFLGRLVSDKGTDVAIKALHRYRSLANVDSDSTLTIIGDGPERHALELLVNKLMLTDYVTFTGSLTGDSLARCLNQHRYMLVPSVWKEPFGIVALEGMACGCIPIVSDGGGLPEAVGKAGLVSKRGDANALADCMIKLSSSPDLAIALRQAAEPHIASQKKNIVAGQYLNLIKNVTAS